ncbi:MAG: carbohydrate ABC transporter permease [Haloechinothrix sp.]
MPTFDFLRRRRIGRTIKLVVLLAAAMATLLPVVWIWVNSLRSQSDIIRDPVGLPTDPQFSNFADAWSDGRFGRLFLNSVIITLPVVLAVVSLSALAGYGLARFMFTGNRLILYVFILGLTVPFQAIMMPLFFNLRDAGLLGTYWAMILPSIALGLPLGIFLMRAFYRGLPRELIDAALVDGCTEFGAFRRVALPLTKPAASALAIFQTVLTWNAFLLPLLVLQREELRPVSTGLAAFQGRFSSDYNLLFAGIAIVTIPVVIVYSVLQRRMIDGITAGALKG